jgi:hypothetical protein
MSLLTLHAVSLLLLLVLLAAGPHFHVAALPRRHHGQEHGQRTDPR